MSRVAFLLAPLGGALLGVAVAAEPDSAGPVTKPAASMDHATPAEKPADPDATAKAPTRAISAHAAELLAAGTTKFTLPKAPEKNSEQPAVAKDENAHDKPANEIVRLPQVTVRAMRIPSTEDMRTPRGLEVYAMNKYLGPPDGFSRGVLNRFTLADAWKHVPILGKIFSFPRQEDLAVDMYYDDEVRKKIKDLTDLQALPRRLPDDPVAPPAATEPSGGK